MNQPQVIITIGAPGSGKSTWAKKYVSDHSEFLYLSSDKMRGELGFGENDQSVSGIVYKRMTLKTEAALRSGQSVLIDATFVKKSWRKDYVNLGKRLGAKLIAHVFKGDTDTLIKRVQNRVANGGMNVPIDIITKYNEGMQIPDKTEFDEIINH